MTRQTFTHVRAVLAAGFAAILMSACGSTEPPTVATVTITPSNRTLYIGPGGGESVLLTASTLQANGQPLTDRSIFWTATSPTVIRIAATGFITALSPGTATVTANSDGKLGTAQITVAPVPIAAIVVTPTLDSVIIGQARQLSHVVRDSASNVLTDRTVSWTSSAPTIATVSNSGGVVTVSVGTAVISATAEGKTGTATVTVIPSQGPILTSTSPTTLVPGTTATINGTRFATPAGANTLVVRGITVPVLTATPTQISFIVPCVRSGATPISVTTAGGGSSPFSTTVAVNRRTLAIGESVILTDGPSSECNELAATGTSARFFVAAFSAATSQNTLIDIELGGNDPSAVSAINSAPLFAPVASRTGLAIVTPESERERAHFQQLERERQLYVDLRRDEGFRNVRASRANSTTLPPPALGEMRSLYYNFGGCADSTQIIRGKVIYAGTRSIIWEDSANTLQSTVDTPLAGYYAKLGQIFDQDQYDAVRTTFGDPLLRDALTDNDGRVHMVFTQRLNGSGAAAYVTSCDQSARNTGTRAGSNFGEFFYGSVPTVSGASFSGTSTPDGWFYFMARTVVHEVKHIASQAARVANNAPAFEQSWLEEGTARHAEEIWVRASMHNVPWKGNTGYGTAATNGVFCDFNPSNATCLAADPLRRPSYGMRRQINEILPKFASPWDWSPYGDGTGQSGSVFYQTVWSLVRYTIDRYGASDAAFLSALTNSLTNGITNLTGVAGAPIDRLIGGWGLALIADDYPGLVGAPADISFPTWNLRNIYSGLNTDPAWSTRFNTPYPILPTQIPFGDFSAQRPSLRGGAHAYYELSGTLNSPQLLHLRGPNRTPMPANARLAIVRVQ